MPSSNNNLQIADFGFKVKEGLPFWSITYFLEKTCINHMKAVTIEQICRMKWKGVPDSQLIVAEKSANLFTEGPISIEELGQNVNYKVLTTKGESADEFWREIQIRHRPVVFNKNDSGYIPLYDYSSGEAARVIKLNEKSPVEGIIRGGAGAFIDLHYAEEREERERQKHQNVQLGQAARNIDDIITTSQKINDPRTPEGVKIYASALLSSLQKSQLELNRKIGLSIPNIDLIV